MSEELALAQARTANTAAYTQHRPKPDEDRGLCAGLFPFHSPLLRESLLVSFPPLNNMLKLSG